MKYEYKTSVFKTEGILGCKVNTDEFDEQLNQLGAEGWELFSSHLAAESYGRSIGIISIFRREMMQ